MITQISAYLVQNWHWFLIFSAMAIIIFLLLRIQVMLRNHMAQTIQVLLIRNPRLCLERLENNRRLKWLYRKTILLLWKLDCYLALGEDEKARQTIQTLRNSRLEPMDKLELFQKELSFFATSGDCDRAKKACADLKSFLKEAGADKEKHYAAIIDEADIIIGVYIDHNVGLISFSVELKHRCRFQYIQFLLQIRHCTTQLQ